MTTCNVGDCTRAPRANNVCSMHYQRKRNTGSYELKPRVSANTPRDNHILRKYGITRDEYLSMLEEQDYRCRICPTELTETDGRIDHDHSCCNSVKTCGKCIRGILCHNCNVGLGLFKDSPELLANAMAYIQALPYQEPLAS